MYYDLKMAVLALAAYDNNAEGWSIADTTIIKRESTSSGFSAYAFSTTQGVVISYTGTDSFVDVLSGWPGGAGAPTSQAEQAVLFAQDVASLLGVNPSTIVYTGHSLGGGTRRICCRPLRSRSSNI